MKAAYKEALKARDIDEVPIGCVIVSNGKIIAKSHNKREKFQEVVAHAELLALSKANKKLHSWRLPECDLYVTVEPCIMCAGAIIQARIKNLVFGAYDFSGGAFGSSINILEAKGINHHPNVEGGIMLEECSNLVKNYFKNKRNLKK